MDFETLLKEVTMLKEENAKLKSQLENYNNSRKKELGYNYEIWVYNSKGVRVEKYE